MSRTRTIAFDTIAIFTGKALGLLMGILRLNFISRYLGVETFGILNFAAYLFALFAVIGDLGLPSILTRDISRSPADTRRLLGTGLAFKAVTLAAVTLCMAGVLLFSRFDTASAQAVLLTLVAFLFTSSSSIFLSALQAHQRMRLVSVAVLLNDGINSVAVVALLGFFPSIMTVLLIGACVAALNFVGLAIICRRLFGSYWPVFDRASVRYFFLQGYPLALSGLGIAVYLYIGSTILKYTRSDAETGQYTAALKLFSILTLLPASLTQVIYPILSGFYATQKEKLPKAFRDSLRVMALASIPIALGTIVLAARIIGFVYSGKDFSPAIPVLAILVGGVSVGHLNWVITSLLLSVNRQKITMIATLLVAIVAVIANMILVPSFGPRAVA